MRFYAQSSIPDALDQMALTRRQRLVILVFLGIVPPSVAILLLNQTITATTQPAIQAAIAGGIITGVGTVASAIYKEVSAYFQQTNTNVDNKVKMVSPLVQSYYTPWIHSADKLSGQMKYLARKGSRDPGDVVTLLYYFLVYYGYRMKFIMEAGGIVLLSTAREQDAVNGAYAEVEKALNWEDSTTHLEVSYLQGLFLNPETMSETIKASDAAAAKPDPGGAGASPKAESGQSRPYLYYQFYNDVQISAGQLPVKPSLSDMVKTLTSWANEKNLRDGSGALDRFSATFKNSIDKLYTAWGE